MSRLPRLAIGGHPHLISQRGLRSQPVFVDDEDRRLFLDSLARASRQSAVALHAYALLDDEILLLVTPAQPSGLGQMMQSLGRAYVAAFNRRHGRAGTLWDGRYRSTVLEAEAFLVNCMRYVETRPFAAGYFPFDYPWSSAAHHIGRCTDSLISDHPIYWGLGNTPFEREAAYRQALERALTAQESLQIEGAVRKAWALGSEQFVLDLGARTGRRLHPLARGRPKKG